jgi:hypothetical protein
MRRRPIIRCGLGGTVLGLATLTGFSFVGVPVIPTDAHGLPLATAGRPALGPALLTAADLPPGFVPAPPTPAPPGADGCAALLANPAAGWAGAVRGQHERAGAALWEAVAAPAGDAVGRLRNQLLACPGVRPLARQALCPDGGKSEPLLSPDPDCAALSVPGGYVAATRVGTTTIVLRYLGPPDPALRLDVTLPAAVARLVRAAR